MRAMFRRSAPLGAALVVLLSIALLSLLFLPAKDEDNLRLVLDWHPTVEPLLLVAGLAALALTGRALRPATRWLLALLLLAAALLEAADAAMLGIFDRELNLYLDLWHVPNLLGLFWDAAGPWRGAAGIAAAALGAVAAIAAVAALRGAARTGAASPRAGLPHGDRRRARRGRAADLRRPEPTAGASLDRVGRAGGADLSLLGGHERP